MIVNWNRYASRVELITRAEAEKRGFKSFSGQGQGRSIHAMKNMPYAAKADVTFMSPLNIPCTAPPWGLITAIDLARSGVPDIDRFTVFSCQDDTVKTLLAADPKLPDHTARLPFPARLAMRMKRCSA